MTNTKNTPIEALERHYPMRVLRYRLRRGSGGAGRHPGGEGIERDLLMLGDVAVSLITERRVSRPWGLAGGGPGAPGENWLLPQGDEAKGERLPDKCTIRLKAGDVLRMLTPGGGGWGAPQPDSSSRRHASGEHTTDWPVVLLERNGPMSDQFTGTSDPTYNIISVMYHALQGAETIQQYLDDPGTDEELKKYFQQVQQGYRRAADMGKQLLAPRLEQESH